MTVTKQIRNWQVSNWVPRICK